MIAVHVFPEETPEGDMTWVFGIAGGRASALFALLAGVSIAFVEKRSRGDNSRRALAADRAALAVRGLLILLVGLMLGHLDTPIATIIPYFGVLFLLALPFYGRSSRVLLVAAAVFVILGPLLRQLLNLHGLIPEQADPDADYTLVTAAQQPVPFLSDMLVTGFYPAAMWMVYLCVGMVIGRQAL
ncbi:heparan-alpha-glucosaminide N-acetyltransferase domain-containing protein, partial [Citricoccus sp.]